jgi:protein-disulfide isomerase
LKTKLIAAVVALGALAVIAAVVLVPGGDDKAAEISSPPAEVPPVATTPAPPVEMAATPAATASAEAADRIRLPEGFPEHVLGDPSAPVTIYEYASLTCPHCADFQGETLPELKTRYIETGQAKVIFRDFPLDNLSLVAHLLTRCAPASIYHPLLGVLFAQQRQWATADDPLAAMKQYARLAGMGDEAIDACLQNETLVGQIRDIQEQARSAYGIASTPSFVIGGEVLTGNRPLDDFVAAIEAAR